MKVPTFAAFVALLAGTTIAAPAPEPEAEAEAEADVLEDRGPNDPVYFYARKPGFAIDAEPFQARHGRIFLGGQSVTQTCPSTAPFYCSNSMSNAVFDVFSGSGFAYMNIGRGTPQQLYVNKKGAISYGTPSSIAKDAYKKAFYIDKGLSITIKNKGIQGNSFYACPVTSTMGPTWQLYAKTKGFKLKKCTQFSATYGFNWDPMSSGQAWAYSI